MRLEGRRVSENIEDRRRRTKPVAAAGGIGVILIVLLANLFDMDPQPLLNQVPKQVAVNEGAVAERGQRELTPEEEDHGVVAGQILALTEDVWTPLLQEYGIRYQQPTMVLFADETTSGCGHASSATGPFYCPADSKVYLDTSFFDELESKFGAPGDFARAYVIAHEIGHHIQHLLGTTNKVDAQRGRISEVEMNRLSVRLELQADFLAGVFAHYLQAEERILEHGDIEEAIQCAMAIGDDRLQKKATGRVMPDSFTHGTSEQRLRWFLKGFETGDLTLGDTFSAETL